MSARPRATDAPPDFRWRTGNPGLRGTSGIAGHGIDGFSLDGPSFLGRSVDFAAGDGLRYGTGSPQVPGATSPSGSEACLEQASDPASADFAAYSPCFSGPTASVGAPQAAATGRGSYRVQAHQSGEQVTNLVNHRFGERLTGSVSPNLVRSRVASQIPSFAFAAIFQPFHPESVRASRLAPAGLALERISR